MPNLNCKEWNKIEIGDLFTINRGNAKNITTKISGQTALVSAIDSKNGLSNCVKPETNESVYRYSYTVNNNGNGVCLAYWHEYPFICSSDVTVLAPKKADLSKKEIAHFIATSIRSQKSKFDYGYKMSNERTKRQNVLLPVTTESTPDYKYMEKYIKDIENKKVDEYLEYAKKELEKLGEIENVPEIREKKWGEFVISKLFTCELSAGDNQAEKLQEGKIPLVSSGNSRTNGIVKFVLNGDAKSELFSGNKITVDMFGFASYQEVPFFAVSHGRINILTPNFLMNRFIGVFLTKAINASNLGKYSYNVMCSNARLVNQNVLLPITDVGAPDYEYMEKYMRNLTIKKYREYIEYKLRYKQI